MIKSFIEILWKNKYTIMLHLATASLLIILSREVAKTNIGLSLLIFSFLFIYPMFMVESKQNRKNKGGDKDERI